MVDPLWRLPLLIAAYYLKCIYMRFESLIAFDESFASMLNFASRPVPRGLTSIRYALPCPLKPLRLQPLSLLDPPLL